MGVLEFSTFITANGIEYPLDALGRCLLTEEGLGMPDIEYITQKGPYQHGETVIDYRLSPRIIQLMIRQDTCSRDEYWEAREALISALRPNRSKIGLTFKKVFSNGKKRAIDVVPISGPVFTARSLNKWDEHGFTETIRLQAMNPTFYDPDVHSQIFMKDWSTITDLVFPITFPISFGESYLDEIYNLFYTGTWESFPVITLIGPIIAFKITNDTTGISLSLNYDIGVGEVVTINLSPQLKTVTNEFGQRLEGALELLSSLATFSIVPNDINDGLNSFRIEAYGVSPTSQVILTYYDRFIGI